MKFFTSKFSLLSFIAASSLAAVIPTGIDGTTGDLEQPGNVFNVSKIPVRPDYKGHLHFHKDVEIRIRTNQRMRHQIDHRTAIQLQSLVKHTFEKVPVNSQHRLMTGKHTVQYHNVYIDVQEHYDARFPMEHLTEGLCKEAMETYTDLITKDGDLSQNSEWALFDMSGRFDKGEVMIATGSLGDEQRRPNA